jgi:antitoxin component of RelBE/YafQ-DinJ toxin-antitoxin module
LAQETNWLEYRFDCKTIEETYQNLDELKLNMEDLVNQTLLINKRQALLGMEQTEFRENRQILEDIKPLHNLWAVTSQFKDLIRQWFEDPLEQLDYQIMETQMEEWNIELKRLQKAQIINENVKQNDLLQFVLECLSYLKRY